MEETQEFAKQIPAREAVSTSFVGIINPAGPVRTIKFSIRHSSLDALQQIRYIDGKIGISLRQT
jgi:hypothetical protein